MTEYQIPVGGFGIATVEDTKNIIVLRLKITEYVSISPVAGRWKHPPQAVKLARPIPGLDDFTLSSFMLPLVMSKVLRSGSTGGLDTWISSIFDAVKENLNKEPELEEPLLFGAVVRDREGYLWQRRTDDTDTTALPWYTINRKGFTGYRGWSDIDAVEVLFPGDAHKAA